MEGFMGLIAKDPPAYWKEYQAPIPFMRCFEHKVDGLTVMRSKSQTKDGRDWIHISMSRRSRMPSYEDMAKVKRDFLGEDVEAYQVFAKTEDHVNIHSFCLHLWAPMDQKRCVANLKDLIDEIAI